MLTTAIRIREEQRPLNLLVQLLKRILRAENPCSLPDLQTVQRRSTAWTPKDSCNSQAPREDCAQGCPREKMREWASCGPSPPNRCSVRDPRPSANGRVPAAPKCAGSESCTSPCGLPSSRGALGLAGARPAVQSNLQSWGRRKSRPKPTPRRPAWRGGRVKVRASVSGGSPLAQKSAQVSLLSPRGNAAS